MDIISIIYFLVPGFFYNYLHMHIWDKKAGKLETEGYSVLSCLVVSSLIINLIYYTITISFSSKSIFYYSIEEIFSRGQGLLGVSIYLAGCFLLAFVGVLFMGTYWSRLITRVINSVRGKSGLPSRNKYRTIYEEVFESEYLKKENNEYPILKLTQSDGIEIIGFLESWSSSSSEEKKVVMFYSKEIVEFILNETYPIEKYVQVEMLDCDTGFCTTLYYGRDLAEKMKLIGKPISVQ
jgi:hypothetical protein